MNIKREYKFRPFEIVKEDYSKEFIPGERSGKAIKLTISKNYHNNHGSF